MGRRSLPPEILALRQTVLDLGPESTFDLVHGKHKRPVAVATGRGNQFNQRLVTHEEARACVGMYAGGSDVFVSQAGFNNQFHPYPRSLDNVSVLPVVFLDLDVYNVNLPGDPQLILSRAFELHPWLPMPTVVSGSGRGVYFQWAFTTPLPRARLAEWQSVEDALVELFAPLGADRSARDAARLLRSVGSTNSKSGSEVRGSQMGNPIPFERLKCAVLDALAEHRANLQAVNTPHTESDARQDTKQSKATAKQRAQSINPYSLAEARMQDLARLVELRGGVLEDGRHRFLYVFGIAACWFRSSVDDVAYECECFARKHFADPTRYNRKSITSILDRYQRDKDKVVVNTFNGKRVPNRYRMRTDTIIRMLGITVEEQRHMKTLIAQQERNRRREERRRAQGMAPRSEYLGSAEARRNEVVRLSGQGMPTSMIAEALGITRQHANRLLASQKQCDLFE